MTAPTPKQRVLESYECGDIGEVEFFELATEAGFTFEEIGAALKAHRIDMGELDDQHH